MVSYLDTVVSVVYQLVTSRQEPVKYVRLSNHQVIRDLERCIALCVVVVVVVALRFQLDGSTDTDRRDHITTPCDIQVCQSNVRL